MTDTKIFIPFDITKTDDEKRMVYGYASTEALDAQGEVVKIDALKDALPDYMKFANVREMHQPSAVGKVKQANIDNKGLYIGAKITDDEAWKKVKDEVYSGYSIGGKVLTKVDNEITKLKLGEISLVDRPANPEAVFDVVKFDEGEHMEKQGSEMPSHTVADSDTAQEAADNDSPAKCPDCGEPMNKGVCPDCGYTEGKSEKVSTLKKDAWDAGTLSAIILNLEAMLPAEDAEDDEETTAGLRAAIAALKPAVVSEIEEPEDYDESAQAADMMMADKTEDLAKATPTEGRNDPGLTNSDYAYVDSNGGQHLPINDEAHVRNAMARWNQTNFESDGAKAKAKSKICSKAKSMGIDGDFCKMDEPEMAKQEIDTTMPTDEEVIAQLTKAGIEVNQQNIDIVREKIAADIAAKINGQNQDQMNKDIAVMDEIKSMTTKLKKMIDEAQVNKVEALPFVYGTFTKNEEVPMDNETTPEVETNEETQTVETEVTDKAEEPTNIKKIDSVDMAKVDGMEARLSKLEAGLTSTLEKLAERLDQIEKATLPIKAKTALIDRFETEKSTSKEELLTKIDEVHKKLQSNPLDTAVRAEADQLTKEYFASTRN